MYIWLSYTKIRWGTCEKDNQPDRLIKRNKGEDENEIEHPGCSGMPSNYVDVLEEIMSETLTSMPAFCRQNVMERMGLAGFTFTSGFLPDMKLRNKLIEKEVVSSQVVAWEYLRIKLINAFCLSLLYWRRNVFKRSHIATCLTASSGFLLHEWYMLSLGRI